jgi:hypothetical protein
MQDRSLDILTVVLFGLTGSAIVFLACLKPMLLPDRIFTLGIGLIGVVYAAARATRCFANREAGRD